MGVAGGPNIERDGLVFGYDTGANPSSGFDATSTSRRYFKGRPTENLITNPLPTSTSGFSPAGGTGTVSYDEELKAIKWEQTAYSSWGAYFIFYPSFTGNLDISSQYTFSLEYKSENEFADSLITHQVVQGNGQSPATTNTDITSDTYGEVDGWKQYRITFTPANTGVGSAFNRFIVGDRGADVLRMWFRNIQFEKNNHKTPFTTGTRSSTQSLIDLTKSTTIDVANVSFGSDGLPTFDGTNDYISLADGTKWFTNEWAYEMVVKFNGNTGSYQGLVWGEGAVQAGYSGYQKLFSYYNYQYFHYRINNSVTGWTNTNFTPSNFTPEKYNHIVWQFSNGVTNLVINGEIVHTDTSRGSYNGGTDSPLFIGCRNDQFGDLNGNLPILKRYNRALTTQEVQQNYKAYKNRFNL